EPAVAPAPEPHLLAVDLLGAFEPELALEIGFGVRVVVEDGGVLEAGGGLADAIEEVARHSGGLGAIDGEVDRSFGEGAAEVAQRHRATDRRHGDAKRD